MKRILNLETSPITLAVSAQDRKKTSASSKGNQVKWSKENHWIKADFMGYEGLAECLASWVAHHTNIRDFAPITDYYQCNVTEGSNTLTGCYSTNFLNAGETCLTIGRLLVLEKGKDIDKQIQKLSTKDRIKTVVDTVVEVTGITNFGKWQI